jgi:hypothetical protein
MHGHRQSFFDMDAKRLVEFPARKSTSAIWPSVTARERTSPSFS